MSLLIFLLASYGTTNIVTSGKIFEWLRKAFASLPGAWGRHLGYWIRCPMCFGFAVGIFFYFMGLGSWYPRVEIWQYPAKFIAVGSISSGFCWVVRVVLSRLGEDNL